jgi:hypothetical protein
MFGIYTYANGLQFTGIVAESEEKAKEYLGNKYGSYQEVFIGRHEDGKPIYGKRFVPYYNKEAFEIKKLTVV